MNKLKRELVIFKGALFAFIRVYNYGHKLNKVCVIFVQPVGSEDEQAWWARNYALLSKRREKLNKQNEQTN